MDKSRWLMQCKSFSSTKRSHDQQHHPNLIHPWISHFPLSPSPNSSFHKNTSPSLLRKSNHLIKYAMRFEGVLATPLPHISHHSPSLSPTPPSQSFLLLSARSCRNTRDPIGALGHPIGRIRTSCRMTCSGLFRGQIVENEPRKIGEDLYIPPKPSNLSPPSLIHLPHQQEDLKFKFSEEKKSKRGKIVIVFIYIHNSKSLVISDCMPRTVGLNTC